MKLVVGLGNPGLEYRSTKHNIGANVVKAIAKEYDISIRKKMHFSLVGKGRIDDQDVLLAIPQTYMNHSGNAVGELVANEAESIKDLIIVCDDINIELGRIRIRKEGSAGGHKGLESIISTLGGSDFARLRVGIATEVHKGDITRYVLSPFKRHEMRNVSHVISLAADAVASMIEDGLDSAMSKFNKRKIGTS